MKQNEKPGKESTDRKEEFRLGQESGVGCALSRASQTFKKKCLSAVLWLRAGPDGFWVLAGLDNVNQTASPELVSTGWKVASFLWKATQVREEEKLSRGGA